MDVYKKLLDKAASDRRLVFVGRIASFASLAIAGLIVPFVERFGGIFQYFQTGVTYVSTPFISVVLMGLLWKRTNREGALFGMIGGIVIQIAVVLVAHSDNALFTSMRELAISFGVALGIPETDKPLHWLYLASIAEVLIICGIVAVSLSTPPPPEEKWRPFIWSPKILSMYIATGDRPWYQSLMVWFVVYSVIWFGIYWYLW